MRNLKDRLQSYVNELIKKSMHNDNRKSEKSQNKLRTYRTFKIEYKQEDYRSIIKYVRVRSAVDKMRLSNHHLMIEKGRHIGIEASQRICKKCNLNLIEDEKHALIVCPAYKEKRNILFTSLSINQGNNWIDLNLYDKFIYLMTMTTQTIQIGKFIQHIMNWDKHIIMKQL